MKKNLIMLGLAALLLCNMPVQASPHHGGPHGGGPAPMGYHHPYHHHTGISFGLFSGYYPRQCDPLYVNSYPIVYPYPINTYPAPYYYPAYSPYWDYGSNVMLNFRI